MKCMIFGTGGIHLITQIGMLESLCENGEDACCFAGVSAGALIASFCATRPLKEAVQELKEIITNNLGSSALTPNYKFLNAPRSALFKSSFFTDEKFTSILKEKLLNKPLRANLYIGVTDETSMTYKLCYYAAHGKNNEVMPIDQAVHGSMSIPLIFPGIDYKEHHYVDGGCFHQVPVEAIKKIINHCREQDPDRQLNMTILTANPWSFAPKPTKNSGVGKMLKKTYRLLDSIQTMNMYSDRLILEQVMKEEELKKKKVDINFSLYTVPMELAHELHDKYPFSKFDKLGIEDVNSLLQIGENIVKYGVVYKSIKNGSKPSLKL